MLHFKTLLNEKLSGFIFIFLSTLKKEDINYFKRNFFFFKTSEAASKTGPRTAYLKKKRKKGMKKEREF